jgi:hypothetical protein
MALALVVVIIVRAHVQKTELLPASHGLSITRPLKFQSKSNTQFSNRRITP